MKSIRSVKEFSVVYVKKLVFTFKKVGTQAGL